ncbi:hypothetical protein KSS87_019694 [Heliosperma pusillum]|nr:hypothetical protein KSS87_019694 [Heliosperma pusillum]
MAKYYCVWLHALFGLTFAAGLSLLEDLVNMLQWLYIHDSHSSLHMFTWRDNGMCLHFTGKKKINVRIMRESSW